MVLESIVNPFTAEKHPLELFFIGVLYTSVALLLSLWVFEEHATLVMIFLTTMAIIPLFYNTIKYEEDKHLTLFSEASLLREHAKAFTFLMFLFLGAAVSYAVWYVVLPAEVSTSVFSAQTQTIISLNQKVVGNVTQLNILTKIFLNNIKVLIFCIIFSFLYGTGAIFILMWNASVIGAALGNFFRVHIAQYAGAVGFDQLGAYLYVISMSTLRYAVHGIPEILGYVIAGLAGGLISVAVIKHDFKSQNFERVILDASDLILLAIFVIFGAALLEVYVTPLFF